MAERRKNFRVEWNSSAKIYDCDGKWELACVVKDLSNGGAKITTAPVGDIPDEFMLRFIRGVRGKRKCKVLWRTRDALGVEFTDQIAVAERGVKRAAHVS
jgi:PilZ domain